MRYETKEFSVLVGKTLTEIEGGLGDRSVRFVCSDGSKYMMLHYEDCCEACTLEDIAGDLSDLIGSPILQAEESSNSDNPPPNAESFTWTFYKLATIKGHVTLRWLGESNGYYSEDVTFEEMK